MTMSHALQHFELIILGCALWILGNGYILWNYPRFGHFCMNSRLSMYLLIDIIATSLICFWWYGYPEYTLYNLVSSLSLSLTPAQFVPQI